MSETPYQKCLDHRKALADVEKTLRTVNKLLSAPNPPDSLADQRQRQQLLRKWGDDSQILISALQGPLQQWDSQLETEERRLPLVFGEQLTSECRAQEIECRQVGQSPPCYRIGVMDVELDMHGQRAFLSYSKVDWITVPLSPGDIITACHRFVELHQTPNFQASQHLERLFRAYRRRLELVGGQPGDRVDLKEIWAEVTFLLQSPAYYQDPSSKRFLDYSRTQFIFDLGRLRQSATLDYKGFRLTLGTATVGSTKDKSKVFYLEESGRGQYYLSLAFTGNRP